jgi:hypothetical protein
MQYETLSPLKPHVRSPHEHLAFQNLLPLFFPAPIPCSICLFNSLRLRFARSASLIGSLGSVGAVASGRGGGGGGGRRVGGGEVERFDDGWELVVVVVVGDRLVALVAVVVVVLGLMVGRGW